LLIATDAINILRFLLMKRVIAVLAVSACLSGQSLKKIGIIDLPGPKGQRFDYLTMDDEDHYLLSAHLGPASCT
jgi:hypothetical protein